MTAALEGGEWSAARPGRTLPPGKTRYPFYRRLGGPQGRCGRAENLVPTGIRSRTVQPVVSRYTDWATRPTIYVRYLFIYVRILSAFWTAQWRKSNSAQWIGSSGVPRNFVRGGSTNSVEDRGQRERGSGDRSPLVRGCGGSCILVQEISIHIVKFS